MKKIYLAVLQWINPSGKNATSRTFRQLTEKRPNSRANKRPLSEEPCRRSQCLTVPSSSDSTITNERRYYYFCYQQREGGVSKASSLECCILPNIYSFLHTWWKKAYLLLLHTTTKKRSYSNTLLTASSTFLTNMCSHDEVTTDNYFSFFNAR